MAELGLESHMENMGISITGYPYGKLKEMRSCVSLHVAAMMLRNKCPQNLISLYFLHSRSKSTVA
jgi:hypothetical protein